MNEHPYSANFRMWSPDGLQVQATVRHTDAGQHVAELLAYVDRLAAAGFTMREPDANAPKPRTWQIGSYVIGRCNAPGGEGEQSCVWLYATHEKLEFRATTVYPEHFAELPFVVGKPRWDGVAPDKATARKRGVLVEVTPFTVVDDPVIGFDGQPVLTDKGQPTYRFARVVKSTGLPSSLADVPAMPGGQPEPKPTNGKAQPAQLASEKTLKRLNTQGREFYGAQWDAKRHELVAELGKRRTPPASITSSKELTEAEATFLADGISKRITARNMERAGQEYIDAHSAGSDDDNAAEDEAALAELRFGS